MFPFVGETNIAGHTQNEVIEPPYKGRREWRARDVDAICEHTIALWGDLDILYVPKKTGEATDW